MQQFLIKNLSCWTRDPYFCFISEVKQTKGKTYGLNFHLCRSRGVILVFHRALRTLMTGNDLFQQTLSEFSVDIRGKCWYQMCSRRILLVVNLSMLISNFLLFTISTLLFFIINASVFDIYYICLHINYKQYLHSQSIKQQLASPTATNVHPVYSNYRNYSKLKYSCSISFHSSFLFILHRYAVLKMRQAPQLSLNFLLKRCLCMTSMQ